MCWTIAVLCTRRVYGSLFLARPLLDVGGVETARPSRDQSRGDGVTTLASLRPIEHAAHVMERIPVARSEPTRLLCFLPPLQAAGGARRRGCAKSLRTPGTTSADEESGLLLRGEDDVAGPSADAAHGHTELGCDLLQRETITAQRTSELELFELVGLGGDHMRTYVRTRIGRWDLECVLPGPRGVVVSTRDFHSRSASSILVGAIDQGFESRRPYFEAASACSASGS
jgi:hypothetical protein